MCSAHTPNCGRHMKTSAIHGWHTDSRCIHGFFFSHFSMYLSFFQDYCKACLLCSDSFLRSFPARFIKCYQKVQAAHLVANSTQQLKKDNEVSVFITFLAWESTFYTENTISVAKSTVVVNQGTFSSTKLETLSNSLSRSKLAVSKAISRFLSRTSNSSKRFRIPWIISSWPFTFSCKRKEVFVTCALLCLSSFRYWGYIYRLFLI